MADLYWIGGSGNWSDTTHWATTSGGLGPHAAPTAADNANFDILSNLTAYPVTLDVAGTCLSFLWANPASGAPSFAGSQPLAISGSMTLVSGMGWTYTGAITFNATSTGKTVTTAAVSLASDITFAGVGGGWTNQDNLATGAGNTILLTSGIWNTNAKTITVGLVNISGSLTRTATFTNSTFNITGVSVVGWNAGTVTLLTSTLTGSTLNFMGANETMTGGGLTYPTVNYTGGGAATIGSSTFGNLSITLPIPGALPFDNTYIVGTWTVTGTLTLSGNSQVNRLGILGSGARTLTAAAVSLTNVDFRQITGAGAATWSGTSLANLGGNSNITFTTPVTAYWVGGTGNWSDATNHWAASSGGSPGAPLPLSQDAAVFDANSFTASGQILTLDYQFYPATNFTGVANSPTIYFFVGGNFYGNLTIAPSMLTLGNGALSVYSFQNFTGTATLTTNGVSLSIASLTIGGPGGGTVSLGDDLSITGNSSGGALVLTDGTFTANNHNVTLATSFTSTGSAGHPRTLIMGTGLWTLGAATGNVWNVASTGLTLTATGSTIKLQSALPTATRTFIGAGFTYNNFTWADESSAFGLTITGANTFNAFTTLPSTLARTLTFPASTTTTITTLSLQGNGGALLSFISSSGGTAATVSVASGTVTADFLSIKDSTATGGATFLANQSVDVSGNTGWTFSGVEPDQPSDRSRMGMGMSIGMTRI